MQRVVLHGDSVKFGCGVSSFDPPSLSYSSSCFWLYSSYLLSIHTVSTLSPLSTLERGYAVVQHRDGRVVVDQAEVAVDEVLRVRVARGDFAASVVGLPDASG